MATSGQLNTNTTYDSYFWVKWEQVGNQDYANNRTQIAWSCGVYCGHSFYSNAIKMSAVIINGSQVYGGGKYSDFSKGNHTIASGTMWITHDLDGKKKFSISSFTGWLYSNYNYSSNGGKYTLTTIPRKATITSTENFTDLGNPTVYYSNPAGNAISSLMACISLTGAKDDIAYRDIPKTENSYQFPLTEAERNILRNNTPSGSREVIFFVRSVIGGVTYHSTDPKKLTIEETDNTRPAVTMTVTLNNGSLPSAFNGIYIQGKSRLDVSLSAEGKYSASIQSYSVSIGGEVYNYTKPFLSNVLSKSGKVDVIGYAKDSRQFTGSANKQIDVIEYSKPLVVPIGSDTAISCYRSDGNGTRIGNSTSVWIKAKRSYYSLSGKNQCALRWRRKLVTEVWNDSTHSWKDLIPKTNTATNEYNALLSGPRTCAIRQSPLHQILELYERIPYRRQE